MRFVTSVSSDGKFQQVNILSTYMLRSSEMERIFIETDWNVYASICN